MMMRLFASCLVVWFATIKHKDYHLSIESYSDWVRFGSKSFLTMVVKSSIKATMEIDSLALQMSIDFLYT